MRGGCGNLREFVEKICLNQLTAFYYYLYQRCFSKFWWLMVLNSSFSRSIRRWMVRRYCWMKFNLPKLLHSWLENEDPLFRTIKNSMPWTANPSDDYSRWFYISHWGSFNPLWKSLNKSKTSFQKSVPARSIWILSFVMWCFPMGVLELFQEMCDEFGIYYMFSLMFQFPCHYLVTIHINKLKFLF